MYKKIILCFTLLSIGTSAFGTAKNAINKNPLEIQSINTEFVKNKGEKQAFLTLNLKLAPLHKAYDSVFKVTILNKEIKAEKPDVAPLSYHTDKFGSKKERLMFLGEGTLRTTLTSANKLPSSLKAQLTYQACTDSHCLLPQEKPFNITLNSSTPERKAASSTKKFFDFSKQSPWTVFLIYLFGFITAFSPCVFPMIPITMGVLGFSNTSNRLKGFTIGLFYSLGLALTYAIVGLVAASTGGFIGQAFTNPYIIWGIFLFYILTAIAMMGFIPIKSPRFIEKIFSRAENKGLWGAFAAGAIGGIVASPCVGPAVAAVLAYVAQSGDPYYGFISLFAYGMGLGTLFILLGTFYGEISSRVKPGPWLNWVKYVMAGLIIIGALLFIKPHLPFFKDTHSHSTEKQYNHLIWKKFDSTSYQKALSENKKVLIDFYADWCTACKELDEKTFSNPEFETETKNFVLFKFDATKPSASDQKALSSFEVFGLPTILFIDSKGSVQDDLTLTGFEKWPDFRERIQEFKKR